MVLVINHPKLLKKGLTMPISIAFDAMIFSKKQENVRYFGYGMVASYLAMSMFNYPFLGKTGILFFLLYGFLASTEDAPHESLNTQTTVSE
jgi:hypothetical protein